MNSVTESPALVEEEFDLREFLRPVLSHWRLILGLGVVAAVVAATINLLLPPTYEAVALVSVALPNYTLRLEGSGAADPLPLRAYPELALTSDLLTEVFTQVQDSLPPNVTTLSDFQKLLSATPASDPALLRLTVEHQRPEQAVEIANAWAAVFVARAGELFGQDQANLAVYEQQLVSAQAALSTAEAELIAYQANNQASLLEAELNSQQAVMAEALGRAHQLSQLVNETQTLQTRLGALSATAPASLAEDLALLSIMTRVYGSPLVVADGGGSAGQGGTLPVLQLQMSAGQPLAGPTVADQRRLAEDLLVALTVRIQEVEEEANALEPTILVLQGELAQARGQEAQLGRERDVADSQYRTLATKIQEANIAAQESSNTVQVVSGAAVPTEPTGFGLLLSAVLAGAVGMLFLAVLVLFVDYWRKGVLPTQPTLSASSFPSAD